MDYENILISLKSGNVPQSGAISLCMGREMEVEEFKELLNKVDEDEKAVVKFVNGEFGAGKSFFLKVVEEMAFDKNFVVSWITLSNDIRTLTVRGMVRGKDYESVILTQHSHAKYYPGYSMLFLKLLFSLDGRKVYGA